MSSHELPDDKNHLKRLLRTASQEAAAADIPVDDWELSVDAGELWGWVFLEEPTDAQQSEAESILKEAVAKQEALPSVVNVNFSSRIGEAGVAVWWA